MSSMKQKSQRHKVTGKQKVRYMREVRALKYATAPLDTDALMKELASFGSSEAHRFQGEF